MRRSSSRPATSSALAEAIIQTLERKGTDDLARRSRLKFESAFQIAAVSGEMHDFYLRALRRPEESGTRPRVSQHAGQAS